MTLNNNSGCMEQHKHSVGKRLVSKGLVLVGLGTMMLAVCFLLPGCGSESTPVGSVKGKDAKTSSTPAVTRSQAGAMLVVGDKGASGAGEPAGIKKQPERNSLPMGGISREEMDARNAAAVKAGRSMNIEVMRGVTLEEMEARNAAAIKAARSMNIEVMPGVTLEEMKQRNAAAVKFAQSANIEVIPGVTLEEMKKRNAAAANAPKMPPIQGKRELPPSAGGK